MDPKLKRILDRQFNLIINSAYGFPHPKLIDNPKEAYERYNKLLEKHIKGVSTMRKWITIMDYNTGTISIYEVPPNTDEEAWIVDNTDFNTDEIHWMSGDRFPTIQVGI